MRAKPAEVTFLRRPVSGASHRGRLGLVFRSRVTTPIDLAPARPSHRRLCYRRLNFGLLSDLQSIRRSSSREKRKPAR